MKALLLWITLSYAVHAADVMGPPLPTSVPEEAGAADTTTAEQADGEAGEDNRNVDSTADPDGMKWFYTRFGESTWFKESQFSISSFSDEEYEKLLTAFAAGNQSAYPALKYSLLKHLRSNPNDPKYAKLKQRVYSPEFIKTLPLYDEDVIKYLPASLSTDREFVLELAKSNAKALQFADGKLKDDRKFVLALVGVNGGALEGVSAKFADDTEIVTKAIRSPQQVRSALQFASERLRNDKKFVILAIGQNPMNLEFASNHLKEDKEVVLAAVKVSACALEHAGPTWRDSAEIGNVAVSGSNPLCAFPHLGPTLRKNIPFMVEASRRMSADGRRNEHLPWYFFDEELWKNPEFLYALAKSWSGRGCPFRKVIASGQLWLQKDFKAKLLKENPECR